MNHLSGCLENTSDLCFVFAVFGHSTLYVKVLRLVLLWFYVLPPHFMVTRFEYAMTSGLISKLGRVYIHFNSNSSSMFILLCTQEDVFLWMPSVLPADPLWELSVKEKYNVLCERDGILGFLHENYIIMIIKRNIIIFF